jgi:crossover junction endodeoxyribonuclease RuvC
VSIKVVGIDPGLAATGIGIVSGTSQRVSEFAFGVVKTLPKDLPAFRLEKIYTRLCTLFSEESPDLLVIEDVFSLEKYPRAAISLGQVCGVVLLASRYADLTVMHISVREAKQVLTGNGTAGKEQLEKAVRSALACEHVIRPYHASDALGLALIGLFRYGDNRRDGPSCRAKQHPLLRMAK